MRKIGVSARVLEDQLRRQSGADYCGYADVQAVTGLSYKQVRRAINPVLKPLPNRRNHLFLVQHVAQVLAGGYNA